MSVTFYLNEDERLHWGDDPSLNVANGNAHIVCGMMGVPLGDCGILPEHVDYCIGMVEAARVEDYVRPDERPAPNWVNCGVTVEQIESYRSRLLILLGEARKMGTGLRWG